MLGTEYDRLSSLDHMYPVWEPHTLWTRFQQSAERFPLQEYIIFEDCSFTYAQVKEQVNSVARSLYALGVRPGTHIAVLLVNSPEFVFLTFALAKLGAVKVSAMSCGSLIPASYLVNSFLMRICSLSVPSCGRSLSQSKISSILLQISYTGRSFVLWRIK